MKNKDRLEKEWEALCAYQAEPNASTVATKDGNAKKNRCAAVVACKSLSLSLLPHITFSESSQEICGRQSQDQYIHGRNEMGFIFLLNVKVAFRPTLLKPERPLV